MYHKQVTITIKSVTDPKDWIDDVISSQLDIELGEYATLDKLTEICDHYDDEFTPEEEQQIIAYFTHNEAS